MQQTLTIPFSDFVYLLAICSKVTLTVAKTTQKRNEITLVPSLTIVSRFNNVCQQETSGNDQPLSIGIY